MRVWDAQSGECLMLTLEDSGSVLSVALSDDGTRIVSGSSDMTVRVGPAGGCESVSECVNGCA